MAGVFVGIVSILPKTGPPIEVHATLRGHVDHAHVADGVAPIPTVRGWRGLVELTRTLAELEAEPRPMLHERLSEVFWTLERFRIACVGVDHAPGEALISQCAESHNDDGSWFIRCELIGTGPPPWPAFPPEHRRDPSWRCTKLDPFTARDHRDGIGTYRRCPACEIEEAELLEKFGHALRKREP